MPLQTSTITDEAAETLLHNLVATPSQSTQESAATSYLTHWMNQHSYDEAFVDEAGNAIGIIGSGSRDVILLGHIDTFSGNPPVHVNGRNLYGRGSVDAKGPLATFAAAARRAKLAEDVRVIVIGAVEEEAASSKGARYAATQYQPEFCIIGEPSQWDRMTLGYKGRLLIDWRWEGALAHSAGDVASAPEQGFAYWRRVVDYTNTFNGDETRIFGRLDATLQAINSGIHGAHGWCDVTVGFRLPPSADPHAIAADLEDDNATTRAYGHEVAFLADRDTSLARAFRGAIRANGGTPRFVHKTGTSDMNIVGPLWNCPILAYGPGDSALDHTPDEHINFDEYLRAIDVLVAALERL
ncbi:[LysW]-lysine hydrolase [Phototrophicus methaneseepsis]|uniref:[LysW]-lysine hydrolase n=2 Tax=Phototrophicus methaneseepsis TaxID=2710758 RepID=A0A7S8EE34_9CHLR|nr:[LysW]-lysine hydrolase [Phototrophicus methaneseepsis]